MGTNGGNIGGGPGGNELGGMMAGNPSSGHPPATEYTLQGKQAMIHWPLRYNEYFGLVILTKLHLPGVMRFLQTEWHRHERDRNAWEIEKQEMKARIAALEGQARRSDATQKALKKYVTILEKKVKDQANQLKGGESVEADKSKEEQREAQLKEHLRCKCSAKLRNIHIENTSLTYELRSFCRCQARQIPPRGRG
jgi:striatin 1/3/4